MGPGLQSVTSAGLNAYRSKRICAPSFLRILSATTTIGAMVKQNQGLGPPGIHIFVHMGRIPLFCTEIRSIKRISEPSQSCVETAGITFSHHLPSRMVQTFADRD